MLENTHTLLMHARQNRYAVGAFNIYNLEGALSVIQSAQELNSPVIVQILPSAFAIGGPALIRMCKTAGEKASVPVSVHLDHCSSRREIVSALEAGISSVMADGSRLDYNENIAFTKDIVALTKGYKGIVEAELGMISGSEDGIITKAAHNQMTDPAQAIDFVEKTGAHALAVCIGNIHGKYKTLPQLDFDRLERINSCLSVPLVLHGTSGLPDEMIRTAIDHGISKFNVNTEIRTAYMGQLKSLFQSNTVPELVEVMSQSIAAMKQPIKEKIRLFGSSGKSGLIIKIIKEQTRR